jgi:ketosteroid isomerase-like protein
MNKLIFSVAVVFGLAAGSAFAADDAATTTDTNATTTSNNNSSSNNDDRQAVEQAVNQFYASLNALFTGETLPMQEIWSHADDVTYMGPVGGFQTGWNQVWPVWQQQAEMKLGGKVLPTELHITVGNDLAFVECYEVGDNNAADGQPIEVAIRATSLLRKENGQWKFIGHHTDPIRALEQDEAQAQPAGDSQDEIEPTVTIEGTDNAPNGWINDADRESATTLEEAE